MENAKICGPGLLKLQIRFCFCSMMQGTASKVWGYIQWAGAEMRKKKTPDILPHPSCVGPIHSKVEPAKNLLMISQCLGQDCD